MKPLELDQPLTAAGLSRHAAPPDLAASAGHLSLSRAGRVDSAGVAQLGEWQAGFGRPLTIHHAPPELARLIALYGLCDKLICA